MIDIIGRTNNLRIRMGKHIGGEVRATHYRRPVKLHSYFAFSNEQTVIEIERYLKSGSGKAFWSHFVSSKYIAFEIHDLV